MRTPLLACAAAALLLGADFRADAAAKPDEEGFIRDWLILAPLPFGGADDGAAALDKQQIDGEAKLQPKEGDKVKVGDKEYTWKKHQATDAVLDINGFLGAVTEDRVAYAVCYLTADEELKGLQMKTGSDDQAKIYLNGKEIFKNVEARPLQKDEDATEGVTLTKGVNVVVFKIVNEKEDWSGCLRFLDKDGKPVTKLKVTLKP
jgi:hypothetical protein